MTRRGRWAGAWPVPARRSVIPMTMAVFAGIHGMNFQHMPELGRQLGQAFALGLMLAIGGALSCSFRRRDLIWVPPRRRRSEAVHS